MLPGWRLALAGLIVAAAGSPRAAADEGERAGEIGLLGGMVRFETDLTEDEPEFRPVAGLRGGLSISPDLDWYVDGLYATTATAGFRGDAQVLLARTGVDYFFSPRGRSKRWFVSGAGGYTRIRFDRAPTFESPVLSAGLGQRIRLRAGRLFRWEVRGNVALSQNGYENLDGTRGPTLNDGKIVVGYGWGLGRSP